MVLGGGYAALAAALAIRKQAPEANITLIAPRKAHIKTTRLHESVLHSLRAFCTLYAELAKRFRFQFIRAKLRFSAESLSRWQERRYLQIGEQRVPFDFLIVATGAHCAPPTDPSDVLDLDDFFLNRAQTEIRRLCESTGRSIDLTVIGGGATGMQFLFELAAYLKQRARRTCRLRLLTLEARLLTQFPSGFHDYALAGLVKAGIEWLPGTQFIRHEGKMVVARSSGRDSEISLPSDLTLLFSGARPDPLAIQANVHGQVLAGQEVLDHIFAAGDCASFQGTGANTLSAQVAVRKGKAVAANILSLYASDTMTPYAYREQGYLVSLGPKDAIGWIGQEDRLIRGLRAAALKSAVERQYDLLLVGVDTYSA